MEQIKQGILQILGSRLPEGEVIHCAGNHDENLLGNSGRLVVYPRDENQIGAILRFANEHSLTVIPEGGGTKRGLGGTLEQADILLSMQKIKGVVEHSVGDLIMTVKAGTTLQEIQSVLAKNGQFLPLDPPFPERSTIGGIVASNASGPKRLRYGSCRDLVVGLRVVTADGTIIRTGAKVVKNVAGYDMTKLFVGSMGTLGIITELHLKLKPLPPRRSLMLLTSPGGTEEIWDFSRRIMDSGMEPLALEVLNPGMAERLAGVSRYLLAVGFEDVPKAVDAQEEWVRQNLGQLRKTDMLHDEEAEAWWNRFAAVGTAPFALKVGSLATDVIPVMEAAEQAANNLGLSIICHGGTGLGISRIYVEDHDMRKFQSFYQTMQTFMAEREGYVIIESAPYTVRRGVSVWGDKPSYLRLLEGIKQKFDPRRVLNPGRFVGGI
ncbi:MAG: FAD-binding oxidoreductase [Brevibacillus sp.]|nr:FAD-binding oxidoreductase [Brevibacillus sp.]